MSQQLESTHRITASGLVVRSDRSVAAPERPDRETRYGPPVPLPSFARHEVAAAAPPARRRPGAGIAIMAGTAVLVVAAVVVGVLVGVLRLPGLPDLPTAPGSTTPAAAEPAALAGRSQVLVAYGDLSSAARTFSDDLAAHGGDIRAQQRDCALYREAVLRFRTAVTGTAFTPEDRQRVDAELLPAVDRTLADLDTMTATTSPRTLVDTAGPFDRHHADLDAVVRSVVGG